MWIKNDDGATLVNSDNVSTVYIAQYKEDIVIRASLVDGRDVTIRSFPVGDGQTALLEFGLIQSQLERDHQRR